MMTITLAVLLTWIVLVLIVAAITSGWPHGNGHR